MSVCVCVGLCMCGFCNVCVCVCVGFVTCGCFGNMCTCIYCFVLSVLFFLYCSVYMSVYSYLFCLQWCKDYCHRVTIAVNNNNVYR